MPVPVTRTNGPVGSDKVCGKPPTTTVALTGLPVVFSSRVSVPLKATPGTFWIAAVAVMRPATPVGVPPSSTSVPEPWVSDRKLFVPSPSENVTLAAPIFTAFVSSAVPGMPSVPESIATCSNVKSPLNRWPPTTSETPVPLSRKYGPAGTSTVTSVAPTRKLCATAWAVVFSASENEPLRASPVVPVLTPIVALSDPATPPVVITKRPVACVTFMTPASVSEPFEIPRRNTFWPAPLTTCSIAKAPVRV